MTSFLDPLQPPARRRSLDEIAAETRANARPSLADIEERVRAGTDLRKQSEQVASSKVPDNYAEDFFKGLARQGAQGLTLNNADEIEAGLRTGFGTKGDYKGTRDQIRAENTAFAKDNPLMAFGAQAAGGMVPAVGAMRVARAVPWVASLLQGGKGAEMATAGQRIASAAKVGAGIGALNGPGAADEMSDIPKSVAVNAVGGGVLGGGLGAVAEGVGAARNLIAGAGSRPGVEAGPVRRFIQAESPDVAGARRVLTAIGRGREESGLPTTLGDVAARAASAHPSTSLSELVPQDQGIRGFRIARNMGRERGVIDNALSERAADAPSRYAESVSRNSGVGAPMDATAYADRALSDVRGDVDHLAGQARAMPDVHSPDVSTALQELRDMGEGGILRRAQKTLIGRREGLPTAMSGKAPADVPVASGPLSRVSDESLLNNYEQMAEKNGRDGALATVREHPLYDEYLSLKTVGNHEDAKGVIEELSHQFGFEPHEFSAIARDSKLAADRIAARSEHMRAVQSEMSRREMVPAASDQGDSYSVAHLQHIRRAIDHRMNDLRAMPNVDKDLLDILGDRRHTVDGVLKQAGGSPQLQSDALVANAHARGDSFRLGQQVETATTPERIMGMAMQAENPQAFQQGSASRQLERIGNVSDGEGGQIRNPVQGTMGSPTRRARAATGYPSQQAFDNVRGDANDIVSQIRARHAISGNSTTAANLSEMADEFMGDPTKVLGAVVNPAHGAKLLLENIFKGSAQGINAQQATQMGRLFSAGLPGQMPVPEAVQYLRNMSPQLREQFARQLMARGAMGAGASATVQQVGRE